MSISEGFYDTNKQHLIEVDTAGFGGWARLTCISCDATLLKKPFMTPDVWKRACDEFQAIHGQLDILSKRSRQ